MAIVVAHRAGMVGQQSLRPLPGLPSPFPPQLPQPFGPSVGVAVLAPALVVCHVRVLKVVRRDQDIRAAAHAHDAGIRLDRKVLRMAFPATWE